MTVSRPPGRLALRVVQFAAVGVVLVVTALRPYELDRFFVPKELLLHAAACVAGALGFLLIVRTDFGRIDWLLAGYLALSAISASMATNPWVAVRAVAISASGVMLFWVARGLRSAGHAPALAGALAAAVVLVAATSLLQTYGLESLFFSINRAPGGTLGNRNFVAHVAVIGLPLVLYAALTARRWAIFLLGAIGVAMVTATLVLTRSRAAWLAFAAVFSVILVALFISPLLRRGGRVWIRLAMIVILSGGAVAAALTVPNTLHWRSDNPYVESMKRVAEFQEGSGRGRLIQYGRSLLLALRHPLLGVGPGNWAVEYPARVPRNDPSLSDSEPGTTSNPWPSSDWIAFASERGFPAAALMVLAFAALALGGLKRLIDARTVDDSLAAMALLGTLVGTAVAGVFDAVLLTAVPSLIVWTALGALWTPNESPPRKRSMRALQIAVVLPTIAICAVGAWRSASQLTAMEIDVGRGDRASLERASKIDPGNDRLHLRLAQRGPRAARCRHARAAHALYPSARAALIASHGCGD